MLHVACWCVGVLVSSFCGKHAAGRASPASLTTAGIVFYNYVYYA